MYTDFADHDEYDYIWLKPRERYNPTHTHVTANIKGCNDAHFLISEKLYDVSDLEAYEIIIGGYSNTRSDIRLMGNETKVTAESIDVMNCNEFRKFWVSWNMTGSITVGSGYSHQHILMHYEQPDPMRYFGYVALKTYDTDLEWRIPETDCEYLHIQRSR